MVPPILAAPPAGQLPPIVTGADMVKPVGNVSTNVRVTVAGELLPLPKVMMRVLVCVAPRRAGTNTLLNVGGTMPETTSVAVASAALLKTAPPGVAMVRKALAEIVLVSEPSLDDVTFTVMLQPPPGMTVPTASVTVLPPALVAAMPEQVVFRLGGAAITKTVVDSDNVSVKVDVIVNGVELGLTRLMTSVLVPPSGAMAGTNLLDTVGAVAATMVSAAVAPTTLVDVAPPAVRIVVRLPGGTVLLAAPSVLDVTLTTILHPPAGNTAPMAKVTVLPPASAAGVPVQVVARLGRAAMVWPVGRMSTNVLVTVMGLLL